ncbi:polyketide synthase family protein [Nostoc sp. PCC 7524]|uniref:beta-ketoacyl synthase N-terminal-like domain-containing protein n=1 Tax=Nostoc sp. (strain ATCC 29411 / PCC 7524) TaxID=28072 RepID=UPI00029F0FC7|nr:beta-ketoacyl synthase N-terminal-like domain-containing protein [Nostoc sp. PCC 7524]AFY47240.1 polyketide synthase family protein [Nostoc sp. PCC 7524]
MTPIAIIGLSCLFPGAENPEKYWQNLIEQKDLTSLANQEQMGVDANFFYNSIKGKTDKYYCMKGGYIRDFQFDAAGYEIAPEILQKLDQLYQWSLYVSRQALKDSGYLKNRSVLSNCGVILGNLSFPTRFSHRIFASTYHKVINSAIQELLQDKLLHLPKLSNDLSPLNALLSGYPAALIAQALSLSGINFSLDAACASSLYAIKLACDYLLSGKADLMLAGAVSCADPLFIHMGFSIFQAYPENSVTRPLDKSSGGLISAEGAGMVVLKRYDDAIRDGDRIYATINGIGLSNDGKGKFVLNPNPKGQILAFERAYKNAGINPNSIDYIECHATGTPIGDITELNSMDAFFSRYQASPLIGSVKSNFGHLLTTAGMTGLIKVILSMNQGVIPPTINLIEPLSSDNGGICANQIVNATIPWPNNTSTKRAAVSAFGFGGTNAHLILESSKPENLDLGLTTENLTKPTSSQNRLAIVGMDACFSSCEDLDDFDRTIYEAQQHFIPVPPQRWKGIELQPELLQDYGFTDGKAPDGAYIQDFDLDFLRFKIPPIEEDQLIPQQLLMLKVADNAIKDAGIIAGENVAVIIAMGTELALHQYLGRIDLTWQIPATLKKENIGLSTQKIAELETIVKSSLYPEARVNNYTSFIGNIMAARIAALWDFSGPAFTVSAEENSVFKSLEIAQMLLSQGEVDAVVVGAVDLAGGFENVLLRHQLAPINTGTHTLSYDINANGWMVGEGAGAVVLKRYETAQQQQERIYAVIDAIALVQNNSQDKFPESVQQVCQQAFNLANIQPQDIGYLEVFGSGIAQEDTAEITGLNLAYRHNKTSQNDTLTCCIGSIKANIGHTYAASGIASLIKTALCLYHRYIPATPQWSKPKHLEHWQDSIFYVANESRTWFLDEGVSKRIAAINGLGLDGTYAHLIISEETSQQERPSKYLAQTPFYLFPLAADNQTALLAEINKLKQQIENTECLATTATQTYQNFQQNIQANYKLAIVGHHREELLKEINLAIHSIDKAFQQTGEWKTPLGSYFTANPLAKKGKIAFVYPGMGSADIGLGKDIFRLFPQVYNTFSNSVSNISQSLCEKLIYPRSLTQLSEVGQAAKIDKFFNDGVAMCLSSISLASLYTLILQDYFQVQPQVACGYSLGEASGMLFALRVWNPQYHSYATSATAALMESPLFKTQLCGACVVGRQFWGLPLTQKAGEEKFWTSYLLKASVLEVVEILKQENQVYLTFINTPQEVVIAGNPQSCLRVIKKLKCRYITINFDSILHCEIVQSVYNDIVKLHTIPIQNTPNIDFYSGVTADRLVIDTNSLAHNSATLCCQKVDFPQLINRLYQDGVRIFIEVGAKNNCSRWIDDNLKELEHIAIAINNKGVDDHTNIVRLLATIISHNVSVNLLHLYSPLMKTSSPRTSIIKNIIIGGSHIYSSIVNDENKSIFELPVTSHKICNQLPAKNINQRVMFTPSSSINNLKIIQLQIAVSEQKLNSNIATQKHMSNANINTLNSNNSINAYTKPSNIVWNEADLLEFAQGNIASIFGQDYQTIDSYSRRVRLPMPPYLLVSRVTKIDAEKGRFKPCSMTTEYDIPHDAWYSVDGQIPLCVAVESGQCDLLLISYLGIDFENKGDLVYRLLDCTLTFLDDFPKEGETLRYDIKINSFVRSGDNLLFFFSYECFVGEKMVLKMDGGCAGFFSDQQLEQGKGIIFTDKELAQRSQIQKQYFEPLLICQKSTFDESDMLNLTEGNIAACFGDSYCQYGLNPSLRLPPKAILMIDRVTSIETTGGVWGLGLIIGEKNLDPEHWYFPCHFKDDQVMAGSLMAEGCSHLLEFYMLYLGLQTYTTDARFQPIPNLPQVVRCRGQVTPVSAKLIYRMEITEIGLTPKPYVKCNVDIILHGKTIVHFQDLGLQLSEKNPENSTHTNHLVKTASTQLKTQKPTLLNEEQVQEFCTGSAAKCFGSEYGIYDQGTVIASRMPNTHLQLVHRVLEVKGQRHQFTKGSTIVTEYDAPLDPWYYRQNSSETIPYSILMEIGLQPCGFLSAYLGTTLLYPNQSLCFRNLDGKGYLTKNIDIRGKTITNTSTLLSSINMKGNILQSFEFKVACDGEIFYTGDASFGYFSPEALANQVGLDRGQDVRPWYETQNTLNLPEIQIDLRTPESRNQYYQVNSIRPNYRLAQYQLDLLHELKIIAGGGNYHQGYIYATKEVKPTDWYFKCHFYLDPVMPGSLGVEAILQAMQAYALHLDLGKYMKSPRFVPVIDHQVIWKYRGQIPHTQTQMYLEIHISRLEITEDKVTLVGDASLWKPNLRIYEIKDVAICLVESNL